MRESGDRQKSRRVDVYFLFRKASILFWPISRTINTHFTSDNELLKYAVVEVKSRRMFVYLEQWQQEINERVSN